MHHSTPRTNDDSPSHEVLQQAAHWFAIISDEQVSATDHARWHAWLQQHPQHQVAWQYVENVSARLQQTQQLADSDTAHTALDHARRDRLSRRRMLQGSGALCLAWLSWRYTPIQQRASHYHAVLTADHTTQTGEVHQIRLQDNGTLWLNSASALNVRYSATARAIELHQGEVLIETGTDSQKRPFTVQTQQGRLRALGTRFTVRQHDNHTQLAVYAGAVEIHTRNGQTHILKAGQQTTFNAQHISDIHPADSNHTAWARGVIVADNIPLAQLITELARYRPGHLGLHPALAELRVVGVYPIDRPDHALAMLAQSLPLRVHKTLPWWVSLEPL